MTFPCSECHAQTGLHLEGCSQRIAPEGMVCEETPYPKETNIMETQDIEKLIERLRAEHAATEEKE